MDYDFSYHPPEKPIPKGGRVVRPAVKKDKDTGKCKGCGRLERLSYGGTLCKDCLKGS